MLTTQRVENKMNKYYRKFKKNSKALSPVVASIILIAVTVAVSVVVAAWMGGMTIGLMGNTEQVSITNVQFVAGGTLYGTQTLTNDTIVVQLQNSGGTGSTVVNTAYVNGANYTITALTIPHNTAGTLLINLNGKNVLQSGTSYSIKLVTAKGTQVSSSATYSP